MNFKEKTITKLYIYRSWKYKMVGCSEIWQGEVMFSVQQELLVVEALFSVQDELVVVGDMFSRSMVGI